MPFGLKEVGKHWVKYDTCKRKCISHHTMLLSLLCCLEKYSIWRLHYIKPEIGDEEHVFGKSPSADKIDHYRFESRLNL